MNVLEVIVLVMVVTIVVTITLAATSYAAFRVRERRRPTVEEADAEGPMFFERVRLPGLVERAAPPRAAADPLGLGLAPAGGDGGAARPDDPARPDNGARPDGARPDDAARPEPRS
jgi:hypothetical protein